MRRRRSLARVVPGTAAWTYELEEKRKARLFFFNPLELMSYDPPEQARLPEEGAWVLVLRELPPLQEDVHLKVTPGRVFWATRQPGCDAFGFSSHGTYKALARTPWGAVGLWPYEYSTIATDRILAYWEAKELVFHPTAENLRFTDALFYIRSRGIALEDAMVMALGTMKGPVGWFEPSADLVGRCAELGRHGLDWAAMRGLAKAAAP